MVSFKDALPIIGFLAAIVLVLFLNGLTIPSLVFIVLIFGAIYLIPTGAEVIKGSRSWESSLPGLGVILVGLVLFALSIFYIAPGAIQLSAVPGQVTPTVTTGLLSTQPFSVVDVSETPLVSDGPLYYISIIGLVMIALFALAKVTKTKLPIIGRIK